jgi:hypothetical protein
VSVVTKVNTSIFPFVLVSVGGDADAHFTDPGHVIVLAVPSAVKIKVNAIDLLAVAGVFEIVKVVTLAFKATVNTCATLKSRVKVFVVIVGLLVGSLYFLKVGLSIMFPPMEIIGLLKVNVPPFVEPILIFVVEDAAPPVPKFNVLVVAEEVAPVAKL